MQPDQDSGRVFQSVKFVVVVARAAVRPTEVLMNFLRYIKDEAAMWPCSCKRCFNTVFVEFVCNEM